MESPIDKGASIKKGKNDSQYQGVDTPPKHMGEIGTRTKKSSGGMEKVSGSKSGKYRS